MVDRRVYIFWALASLAALAWHPFVLGFYVDDWFFLLVPDLTTPAFSAERWAALELAQNRPVFRFAGFLLGSILPPSPMVWHLYVIAIVFATSIALYHFCSSLLRLVFTPKTSTWAASVAGVFWLVFPWGAPINFWPTGTIALISIIALCLSGQIMIEKWTTNSPWPYISVFFFNLIGYLNYEAIYLQIFLIIAFTAWRLGWNNIHTLFWMASAGMAQISALGFNRYMRATGAEGSRAFNADFIETFFHWFGFGARNLGISWLTTSAVTVCVFIAFSLSIFIFAKFILKKPQSTNPYKLIGTVLFWAALITCAIAVTLPLPMAFLETAVLTLPLIVTLLIFSGFALNAAKDHYKHFVLMAIVLCLIGLCLGGVAYAAGHYVMWSTGIGGRVLIVINIWIAMLIALCTATILETGISPKLTKTLGTLLWGTLLMGTVFRGAEWHNAWSIQQQAHDNAPKIEFGELGDQALYLYIGPEQDGWVPAIETNMQMGPFAMSAFWGQAVSESDKLTIKEWNTRWFVSRPTKLLVKWDGQIATYASCEAPKTVIESRVGAPLWVWNGFDGTFTRAQPGLSIGC
ncbi:MAG: hypothetical protein NUV50_11095 [Rhodospirillales bacterium]|nr:hypothetical protein [Rhodospirillales bacterium]